MRQLLDLVDFDLESRDKSSFRRLQEEIDRLINAIEQADLQDPRQGAASRLEASYHPINNATQTRSTG